MVKPLLVYVLTLPLAVNLYTINITQQSDNTYQVDGEQTIIKTRLCKRLAVRENVILELNSKHGVVKGKLIFKDITCDVIEVFN